MLHSHNHDADCFLVFAPTESGFYCLNISNRALFQTMATPNTINSSVNLSNAGDLNPNVAITGLGSFSFKTLILHLLLSYLIFHALYNLNASHKKYTFKNGSIYPFPKFQNNPLIFIQLNLGSSLNLFTFVLNFSVYRKSF
jgi:hypothetical protein